MNFASPIPTQQRHHQQWGGGGGPGALLPEVNDMLVTLHPAAAKSILSRAACGALLEVNARRGNTNCSNIHTIDECFTIRNRRQGIKSDAFFRFEIEHADEASRAVRVCGANNPLFPPPSTRRAPHKPHIVTLNHKP